MVIINLTPHRIVIFRDGVSVNEFPTSGQVARCEKEMTEIDRVEGVPIYRREYGEASDLPEPQEGVLYIVSTLVRLSEPYRTDLLSPGDRIRDGNDRIVGCLNLIGN